VFFVRGIRFEFTLIALFYCHRIRLRLAGFMIRDSNHLGFILLPHLSQTRLFDFRLQLRKFEQTSGLVFYLWR